MARSLITARSLCRYTVVSHLDRQNGDRSFLLIRERFSGTHTSECLALHGTFGLLHESLHRTLLGLSHSFLPLVIDLRGVCGLDKDFLVRLLKVQRETAPIRSVTFQIAADGPVLPLIQRLGLEERFGLESAKPLPQPMTSIPLQPAFTRRTQWATNENH